MNVDKVTRNGLLTIAKKKRVYLEGNILKIIDAENQDKEFRDYLDLCKAKDVANRKKRLQITKQVQQQNKELAAAAVENEKINKQLTKAWEDANNSAEEAIKAKAEAEKLRDAAVEDLDTLQKRTQFELIGLIVKTALWIIGGVGILTSCLYLYVLTQSIDAKIIESTWSNLFGILLTNSFSIIGTIMGVKYATGKTIE